MSKKVSYRSRLPQLTSVKLQVTKSTEPEHLSHDQIQAFLSKSNNSKATAEPPSKHKPNVHLISIPRRFGEGFRPLFRGRSKSDDRITIKEDSQKVNAEQDKEKNIQKHNPSPNKIGRISRHSSHHSSREFNRRRSCERRSSPSPQTSSYFIDPAREQDRKRQRERSRGSRSERYRRRRSNSRSPSYRSSRRRSESRHNDNRRNRRDSPIENVTYVAVPYPVYPPYGYPPHVIMDPVWRPQIPPPYMNGYPPPPRHFPPHNVHPGFFPPPPPYIRGNFPRSRGPRPNFR